MVKLDTCLFCKIVHQEIPCARVFENEHVIAFLDINPIAIGHVLVLPKGHYPTLVDVPDEECGPLMQALRVVGQAVQKSTRADGFNVLQNNYKAAGQVVFHAHFHIIPRFLDDGLPLWSGNPYATEEDMKGMATAIASAVITP